MPPAAGRERGVIKLIKCTTTPAGFFVSYDYAFISPDSGPESPDVFLHATDVGGLGRSICEGDTVEYCVVDYKGRRKAVDVVKVLTSVKYLVPILRPIDAAAASAGSGFEPDADADATRPAPEPAPSSPPPRSTCPSTPLSAVRRLHLRALCHRILALEPPHVAKDGRRAPVDDPHRQPRGQATHRRLPRRDEAPAGRDRRLRRGRDEDPVVRVTITTSKSRKRHTLVAKD